MRGQMGMGRRGDLIAGGAIGERELSRGKREVSRKWEVLEGHGNERERNWGVKLRGRHWEEEMSAREK